MSKLAHSNDETMEAIEADRIVRDDLPTALTVVQAIALADGLPNHPDYLTKTQIIALAKAFLRTGPRDQREEIKRLTQLLIDTRGAIQCVCPEHPIMKAALEDLASIQPST